MFTIIGPKILGNATDELFQGIMGKITGTSDGIDFGAVGSILLWLVGLYVVSALFSYLQGYIMTGVSMKVTYNLRNDIIRKINRMPLSYFDRTSHGEVLSRVTNDVDTLSLTFNQRYYPDYHFHCDFHWYSGDDVLYQLADDPGSAVYRPGGADLHHGNRQAFPEIF